MDTYIPSRILIAPRAISQTHRLCEGLKRPLIIADPVTYRIAGRAVERQLASQAEIVQDISKFKPKTKPGYIVAVGGGKILDLCKLLAFRADIPFVAIPTVPSHDGIFSPTVTLHELGISSLKTRPPWAVVADIDILAKAPKRMIAAGAADALAKYTSVWDWRQAAKRGGEEYSNFIAKLALLAFELVRDHPEEIAKASHSGIKVLVESLFSSGLAMCLAGSSKPASGAEHNFSHALDSLGAKIMHGESVGLGTILAAYLQKQNWKLIKSLLERVGAPTTAKEAGLDRNLVIRALMLARTVRPRWTVLNTVKLGKRTAEKVCLKTGIIF